jgi:hypothetical protein
VSLPAVIASQVVPAAAAAPTVAPADFLTTAESWLSGTTSLLGFTLPNGLLAGAAALGAWFLFSGGAKGKRGGFF